MGLDLSERLTTFRESRLLSREEAARLGGTTDAVVQAWENGSRRPTAAPLRRYLEALEADPGLVVRLTAAADPEGSRFVLADGPLGPPLHLGFFLKAIRQRRRLRQDEVATIVGVAQGTIAKWELGDAVPAPARLHEVAFRLAAAPEELLALSRAGVVESPKPWSAERYADVAARTPESLKLLLMLGVASELWSEGAGFPSISESLFPHVTSGLAYRYTRMGQTFDATHWAEVAERSARRLGIPRSAATARFAKGRLASAKKRHDDAIRLLLDLPLEGDDAV